MSSSAAALAPYDPQFLIDTILPAKEIHLLAGPSGAGKTKWLLSWLQDWQRGAPVLGYSSHPLQWAYAACDRSTAGFERTMEAYGLRAADIPFIPAWDKKLSLCQVMTEAENLKAKLVIIEAFGSFCEPPGNNKCVKAFLQAFHQSVRDSGMTIIGVMESPKQKVNEGYENPRQRISGVASWSHFTETVMLVEFFNPREPTDPYRKLTICPRNAAAIEMKGQFDMEGRLHFTEKIVDGKIAKVQVVN